MKKYIPFICAVILVTGMVATAEISGEKEILFPEIAAISAGAFAAPKFAWNTSLSSMFLLLMGSAIIGTLLVLIPLPFVVQMCLAFLVASVILTYSKTTFAPMISAIVLPVMMHSASIVYPISAIILSAVVIVTRKILERCNLVTPANFSPDSLPDEQTITDMLLRWLLGCAVILVAIWGNCKMMVAPPLLVAYTEFWKPNSGAQRQPLKVNFLVAFCAVTGTIFRLIALHFGYYQFLSAGITILLVLLLMQKMKTFIPPASALSILAFLIPENQLLFYLIQIMIGTAVFTGISLIHGKISPKLPAVPEK